MVALCAAVPPVRRRLNPRGNAVPLQPVSVKQRKVRRNHGIRNATRRCRSYGPNGSVIGRCPHGHLSARSSPSRSSSHQTGSSCRATSSYYAPYSHSTPLSASYKCGYRRYSHTTPSSVTDGILYQTYGNYHSLPTGSAHKYHSGTSTSSVALSVDRNKSNITARHFVALLIRFP